MKESHIDELPELAHRVFELVSTGQATEWTALDPDVQSWWRRVALALVGTVVSKGAGFGGFTVTNGGRRLMAVHHEERDEDGLQLHVYPATIAPPHVMRSQDLAEYMRLRAMVLESIDCPTSTLSDGDAEIVGRFLCMADECIGVRDPSEQRF